MKFKSNEKCCVQAADFLVDEAMLQDLCSALGHRMFPHGCWPPNMDLTPSAVDDSLAYIHQVRRISAPKPPLARTALMTALAGVL